jgi:riboflavin-specific deaminase-like protein
MHVTLVCAISLDGKLSTAARDPVRFTSRRDRERLHALRDSADALLVGAATIRAEDPPLLPDAARADSRVAAGKKRWPVRAIASRTLDLPLGRSLVRIDGAPTYVFTSGALGAGNAAARERLEAAGVVLRAASLTEALQILGREQGAERVVAEGGGVLNAELFAADLVDDLELTVAPVILGGSGAPTLVDGPGFSQDALKRARLVSHEATSDGELFLKYSFRP